MPLPDLEPPFGRLVHEMWESAMTRNQRDARYCDICKRSERGVVLAREMTDILDAAFGATPWPEEAHDGE
jgi:hypothetical protein